MPGIIDFCESERGWLIETIETLVALESPTTDKAAVDRCSEEAARRLGASGAGITRIPETEVGDHLRAEFGAGARQLLLLCHIDTVWPLGTIRTMPVRHDGSRLYGPGAFDMKGGIGIAMLALRALYEVGPRPAFPVVMLVTSDEETGSRTSRRLIEAEARQSRAVLVFEPALPGGAVKTARKGCGEFELVVRGVTAHAGIEPGRGSSAIHELAEQILAIERLQDPDRGISVNVGVVAGGMRPNVVAGEARARIDARVVRQADAAGVEAAIRSLTPRRPRTRLEVTGGFERPPMERTPEIARLFALARDVAADLGIDLKEGATGGGSDGNFTAALGVPTLDGLGALGDGAHADHEHIDTTSLAVRAAFVAHLIMRLEAF